MQLTKQIQNDECHVEIIVNHGRTDGQFQVKIKWLCLKQETWEPLDSIAAYIKALMQQDVQSAHLNKPRKMKYSSLTAVLHVSKAFRTFVLLRTEGSFQFYWVGPHGKCHTFLNFQQACEVRGSLLLVMKHELWNHNVSPDIVPSSTFKTSLFPSPCW